MKNIKNVTIIDYGMGNIASIERAFQAIGSTTTVTSDHKIIESSDRIILPGVGGFGDSMSELNKYDLIEPIKNFVKTGKPLLGICLGMQILFESSKEKGNHQGLGLIEGKVQRIPCDYNDITNYRKIPHIGWNTIIPDTEDWNSKIFFKIPQNEFFYFVHSYLCILDNNKYRIAYSKYKECIITSAIQSNNIIGLQFHPEKSGKFGLNVLENFINFF